jgi:dihydrofolate reductase
MFSLTLHMVSSLDGYIAKPDNSIGWFETPDDFEGGVDPMAAYAAMQKVDCYVMGSKTYELAMELSKNHGWPYGETPIFVLTTRALPRRSDHIELFQGKPDALVSRLKSSYTNVWLVGGAEAASTFLRAGLVDEIRHNILPILLGEGLPFYDHLGIETPLHLVDAVTYKTGMVELRYSVKRE